MFLFCLLAEICDRCFLFPSEVVHLQSTPRDWATGCHVRFPKCSCMSFHLLVCIKVESLLLVLLHIWARNFISLPERCSSELKTSLFLHLLSLPCFPVPLHIYPLHLGKSMKTFASFPWVSASKIFNWRPSVPFEGKVFSYQQWVVLNCDLYNCTIQSIFYY